MSRRNGRRARARGTRPLPARVCTRPGCPYLAAPAVPGHYCCEDCLAKVEARAAELREQAA
jgi:hypothetical protein